MQKSDFVKIIVSAAAGFAIALAWVGGRPSNPPAQAVQPVVAAEDGAVEKNAQQKSRAHDVTAPAGGAAPAAPARRSVGEILEELAGIQVSQGPDRRREEFRIMSLLEQLGQCDQSSLPALRAFLASRRDVKYDTRNGKSLLPQSLRLAVFDIVRQVGGTDSAAIFKDALTSSVDGSEFRYLAQTLESQYPGTYRATTLAAAKNLLAAGGITDPKDRNRIYDVLLQLNDTSYLPVARESMIQPDGRVDISALRYVQQALGEQSLAVAEQVLQDARVQDADSREALGRVGMTYVGSANDQVNDRALQIFHQAINDPTLLPKQRRNLIEDLNEAGLSNPRSPTPDDLNIIAKRNAIIRAYQQEPYVQNDPVASSAFHEAGKDTTELLQNAGINAPAR